MTEEQFNGWPLPKGWACARFEDVADIAQNLVAPSKVLDLPHIAPNHIGSGNRQLLPYLTVRADAVISSKQHFYPGQILFTKIRPYLLKSVLVDFEGVCSADMYPLWTKDTAEPKYLLYWLTSHEFRDVIAHEQGRTVLPKINQAALNKTLMALPPLPEQRRIVAKIESLSAKSSRARQNLNHIPRLVEKYKQAILAAAFNGELTRGWREARRETSKWSYVSAGTIIESIVAGKNLRCEERPPNRNEKGVLKVSAVTWGNFDPSATKTLPKSFSPPPQTRVQAGDFLISRANTLELVGAVVIVNQTPPNLFLSDKTLRLEISEQTKPWLLWFLRSPNGRSAIETSATGNQLSMRNLSQSALREIEVPWTGDEERREIVRCIEKAFAWINRLASEATSVRKLIDHLDQAILAKAFRGELVPQHPNDEPASLLLERIKAEQLSNARASKERKNPSRPKLASSRGRKSTASYKRSVAKSRRARGRSE